MIARAIFAVAVASFAWVSPASALDLNSFRAQHALPRLAASGALTAKARAHAADMARRQSMDHNGFTERMRGVVGSFAAENVGVGCPTADCVFKLWADSPGHRANMLNGVVTHYGLASAKGADGRHYWALELANQSPPARRPGPSDEFYFHFHMGDGMGDGPFR